MSKDFYNNVAILNESSDFYGVLNCDYQCL